MPFSSSGQPQLGARAICATQDVSSASKPVYIRANPPSDHPRHPQHVQRDATISKLKFKGRRRSGNHATVPSWTKRQNSWPLSRLFLGSSQRTRKMKQDMRSFNPRPALHRSQMKYGISTNSIYQKLFTRHLISCLRAQWKSRKTGCT